MGHLFYTVSAEGAQRGRMGKFKKGFFKKHVKNAMILYANMGPNMPNFIQNIVLVTSPLL